MTGSPVNSRITASTTMDSAICSSSIITYASGSAARGKRSARISGRLSVITVDVVMKARCVKLNTNTPVTRKPR